MILMKRTLSYFFCLLSLAACSSEKLSQTSDAGYISVDLFADMPTKAPVALTDAEAGEYNISILDADGNQAVYQAPDEKKGDFIPVMKYKDFETVTVEVGKSYSVTAESCTVQESEVGYGCARFFGTSGLFELNASNIYQKADVVCSQTNALVTVVFDSSVSGRFTGLQVTLVAGDRNLVVAESAEETPTYFSPADLAYTITGIYSETGYEVEMSSVTPLSLEAKDNIRIIVKLDLTHGQTMVPVLSVTEEYASETDVDYEIDPYL